MQNGKYVDTGEDLGPPLTDIVDTFVGVAGVARGYEQCPTTLAACNLINGMICGSRYLVREINVIPKRWIYQIPSLSTYFLKTTVTFLLLLFTTFPSSIEAFKCDQNGVCNAASEYNASTFFTKMDPHNAKLKECDDGCAIFSCVVDEKKVMSGAGCYSDFVNVCKDDPAEAKLDVKEISIKAQNLYVVACKGENCTDAANSFAASEMRSEFDFFSKTFIDGMDKKFSDKCEYPGANDIKPEQTSTTTKADSGTSGFMNQMDGFKLFGMILSGFALNQFW